MKISIFTDASIEFTKGAGGFAFYIGCINGKLQKAGTLKAVTTNICLAELHCIANALYTLKHSKFKPISKVWLFTDNKASSDMLENNFRGFREPELRDVVEEIRFLCMEICLRENKSIRDVKTMFTFQHIKAHTGKKDRMSEINAWCDKNAKMYMKRALNKLSKK
jgi:ribonuclease HI